MSDGANSRRTDFKRTCLSIILAAGEGTRMRSRLPKVLHLLAGRSMVAHVLTAVRDAGGTATAVVIGPGYDAVEKEAKAIVPDADVLVQKDRLGTGHAVLAAKEAIARGYDDIVIAFGDTPLIRPDTLARMRAAVAQGAAVVVLGFRPADPTGYGRLLMEGAQLVGIREERDATEAERASPLGNAGLMALDGRHALALLEKIDCKNAKGEFYLTDIVTLARIQGLTAVVIEAEEDEVRGINTKAQLAEAEAVVQQRLRQAALEAGVTMTAPETVFLAIDTRFGRDVVVEPYVVFGPGTAIDDGATIRSFSHLTGAHVGADAIVGPYARLRPGADLGAGSHVGNFVEIKEARLGAGAKANHLAYIGDSDVGAGSNIGAGAITCNYDGTHKHRTVIGAKVFVGTNSSLVAPVTIGDGAYIGSGSVITQDVPTDALAVGRGRQVIKEGWAKSLPSKRPAGKE